MRDELDGRIWTDNHREFSHGIGSFFGALRDAMDRLNAIQFAAPRARSLTGERR